MRLIHLVFMAIMLFPTGLFGADACSLYTETTFTDGQVLTHTRMNQRGENVLAIGNNHHGSCVQDDSMAAGKLDSDGQSVLTGARRGCQLYYVDADTVGVRACSFFVGGTSIVASGATTVTWGCSGCTSESNTWFYIYGYDNSGSIALEISSTAPNYLLEKTGDSTRIFMGSFYNSGGSIRPFKKAGPVVSWYNEDTKDNLVSATGCSAASTAMDVSAYAPTYALLYMRIELYNNDIANDLFIGDDTVGLSATSQQVIARIWTSTAHVAHSAGIVSQNSSQEVDWACSTGGVNDGTINVGTTGYIDLI